MSWCKNSKIYSGREKYYYTATSPDQQLNKGSHKASLELQSFNLALKKNTFGLKIYALTSFILPELIYYSRVCDLDNTYIFWVCTWSPFKKLQRHIAHRASPSDTPALFILAFHTGGSGLVSNTEECIKTKLRSQQNAL